MYGFTGVLRHTIYVSLETKNIIHIKQLKMTRNEGVTVNHNKKSEYKKCKVLQVTKFNDSGHLGRCKNVMLKK